MTLHLDSAPLTTDTLDASRGDIGSEEVGARLLRSAAARSYNPQTDLDWDEPIDPTKYGFSPEWSTLYGTRYWDELSEAQRIKLTHHEVASVMSMGIWFEMILQQMMLRDQFLGEYHHSEFQWSLTEIADECRHSIMFARASDKITGCSYYPPRYVQQLSKLLGHVAGGEWAYGSILVAEEILDVLQRGCMEDDRVLPIVRGVNTIHVLEESRHMRFAREEMRDSLAGASTARKEASGDLIALVAFFILRSLISPQAYADAGLDPPPRRARGQEEHALPGHDALQLRPSRRLPRRVRSPDAARGEAVPPRPHALNHPRRTRALRHHEELLHRRRLRERVPGRVHPPRSR